MLDPYRKLHHFFPSWPNREACDSDLTPYFKIICCSFRTISLQIFKIYQSYRRSRSLIKAKRKGNPPICTTIPAFEYRKWRQLAQTSSWTKASCKASHGMTLLITLFCRKKKHFFIQNVNKKKPYRFFSKNISKYYFRSKNLGGGGHKFVGGPGVVSIGNRGQKR